MVDAVRAGIETPAPRTGSASPRLDEPEFTRRFLSQFQDQAYAPLQASLDRIASRGDAYSMSAQKAAHAQGGPGFADLDSFCGHLSRARVA